jgi:hypothetical protein
MRLAGLGSVRQQLDSVGLDAWRMRRPRLACRNEATCLNSWRSKRRSRVFPLIVVIVADHRGPASGPPFVKAMNIGVLEQVADRHIDRCAWRRLT